ncbi:leucine-rich repeat-containing protein 36-like [Centruroides vittatus]|uniref:leucine-rich repeat-containing protein 36-like n=1 Tax=Centruroides vittatus TaxID=120091 RepID=UPI00350F368D
MATLTENVVLARTRAQDLKSVRKLNCWGSELMNISIIRKMPNVEVLSLSVNCINTLADFAHCKNLQELYIRKNNITNLNEVCYLQELPNLRSLWLADNPCTNCEKYRISVLHTLPFLKKLDNVAVQTEEVEYAKLYGVPLKHPLEINKESVSSEKEENFSRQAEEKKYIEVDIEDNKINKNINNEKEYKSISESDRNGDVSVNSNMKNSISTSSLIIENYDHQNVNIVSDHNINNFPESPQHAFQAKVKTLVDHSGKPSPTNNDACDNKEQQYSPASPRRSQMSHSDSEPDGIISVGDSYRSHDSECSEYVKRCRSPNFQVADVRRMGGNSLQKSDKIWNARYLSKGGRNRNSNILSAVLCLIKELDYAGLEVVDTAIHCRLEEMDD